MAEDRHIENRFIAIFQRNIN